MSKVPQDLEAEARILGGAMASVDWANDLVANIKVKHFADERNRQIFAIINDLTQADQEVNLDKVIDLVGSKKDLMEQAIVAFQVGSLMTFDFSTLKESLIKCYFNRSLQSIFSSMHEMIGDSVGEEEELLRQLDQEIQNIHGDSTQRKTSRNMTDVLNKPKDFMLKVQEAQERFRKGEEIYAGLPSGYSDLDKMINSLRPGHLMVVGARPSVGKTTFATNLVENICLKFKEPGLFISLEMPAEEITTKLLCQAAEVSAKKVDKGQVSTEEFHRLVEANKHYASRTIIIEDQPGLGIDQIKMRAIRAKKAHGIKFIIIDYLQLITSTRKSENRQVDVSYISKSLKELAKILEIPVIALAQLNRESEKRESHTPMMSDLRESGGIEADADEILLLHRKDMYNPTDKPGQMQVYVAKNRFGETGMFNLNFRKEIGKLESYEPFVNPAKF